MVTPAVVRKRLLPLYVAVFLQGFVLWYATEKLFMTSIGFNATTIGLMVALYSAVIILAETPSGILADRWSRKGVLILASVALALSGLVGGLSHNIPVFLIATCLWGMFFALYSGTYDSMIYDTLLEETKSNKEFQRYLGRMHFIDGAALVLGALVGGLIAQYVGLRETYLFTVPLALASGVALLFFREPQLHKMEVASPVTQHIKETLSAVLRQSTLVPILIVLITTAMLSYIILEFTQLWLIALLAPLAIFGPIDALVVGGYGLGGAMGGRLRFDKSWVLMTTLAALLLSTLGLIYTNNLVLTSICLALSVLTITAITVVFTKTLHDSLSSKIRAGASSAVSTMSRIIIIPVVLLFGSITHSSSIFQASWILVILAFIVTLFTLKTYTKPQ